MNENLQNALADIIVSAAETVEQGKEFILEQTPDVVQQLLMWEVVSGLVAFSAGILLLIGNAAFHIKVASYEDLDGEDRLFMHGFIGGLLLAVTAVLCVHWMSLDWLKALIAPKLFLLEYAAKLVK